MPAWMSRAPGEAPPVFASSASTSAAPSGLSVQSSSVQQQQPSLLATQPPAIMMQAQSFLAPPRIMPLQPWMEIKHPETGKVYYYNQVTQQSTFDKPEALKSLVERQLPFSPWREYVKEGKSYFVNSQNNQSVWEEPMDFTTHKQKLTAMCAGEAPTRDMASLALYTAARKALEVTPLPNA